MIYIVDDDDALRGAIAALMTSVGYTTQVFARAGQFLAKYDPNEPACLISDVRMPEMSGIELQQRLNTMGALLPVIFITGHADVSMAVQAMKDGAFDFLPKPFRNQDLLDRVNAALRMDAETRVALQRDAEVRRRGAALSPREREVLELLVEGKSSKMIASQLALSERTVEVHRANIMEKMAARSIAHLVRMQLSLRDATR